jgi:hypothetical protein
VRSGPGEARTILLHIISVRPSKQPLMVRTFLKVYMELGSYFLFLQEQIKDMIIKKPVTKEQKVPGVFDLDLACGGNSVQCCDFKQLGTKCGGHGKSCAEVSRHRRLCDLPWAGGTTKCCSDSSVVCLRDFVVVCVLSTARHCVCAGASDDEA